ncbi:hypothetical protein P9112_007614 [Eukaryota sp. TZLM1-RC]
MSILIRGVNSYKALQSKSMINRIGAILSFTLNLCDQLSLFRTIGKNEKPCINAVIGTRGSGKTTFGASCLHSLVEPNGRNDILSDLYISLGHSQKVIGSTPCIADLLVYLYLSGRFVAMELPDCSFENATEYLLEYIALYLNIPYSPPTSGFFFSNLKSLLPGVNSRPMNRFLKDLDFLLSRFSPKTIDNSLSFFQNEDDALNYWKSLGNESNLPFLFFFDEIPSSNRNSNCEGGSVIPEWFPFFRNLIHNGVGLPFVAGLYRQYIQQCLENSKFKVITYRLEAISDLNHLYQFIQQADLPSGVNLTEALKCLIQCSGNPRTIIRTLNAFKKTRKWNVSPEINTSDVSPLNPLIQALAVAAFPLALSPQMSSFGEFHCDQVRLNSGNLAMDCFEADAFFMLNPLVLPPPQHSRDSFQLTRYHCILSYFDLKWSISCYVSPALLQQLDSLINTIVDLFIDKKTFNQVDGDALKMAKDKFATEMGKSFEELIGNFLILRSQLFPKVEPISQCHSLIYLFGPSQTSSNPDHCIWNSQQYSIQLKETLRLKVLHFKPSKAIIKNLKIQCLISQDEVCTWKELESCRGNIWKNGKDAAGPDLILIDGKPNSQLIIGVDAKSNLQEKLHKQFATQFIQSLASHPPVPVLVSIRCRMQAREMYQISTELDSTYVDVYEALRSEFPERYPWESFSDLVISVKENVGVIPQHILLGNEFFGPTISNLLKIYSADLDREDFYCKV